MNDEKINFELLPKDIGQFNYWHHRKFGRIITKYYPEFLILPALFISLIGKDSIHSLIESSPFIIIISFAYLYLRIGRKWRWIRYFSKNYSGKTNYQPGSLAITFSSEKVTEENEKMNSNFQYSAFEKLHITPDGVYIYFSPLQALVIPKRAFNTDFSVEGLMNLLKEKTGNRIEIVKTKVKNISDYA